MIDCVFLQPRDDMLDKAHQARTGDALQDAFLTHDTVQQHKLLQCLLRLMLDIKACQIGDDLIAHSLASFCIRQGLSESVQERKELEDVFRTSRSFERFLKLGGL